MPGGVKENVDYTLTVGANPAVGYDDNGTVSTNYRHTVTVVNPQVKYGTILPGDVNGDGSVNMKDWIRLKNHLNESDILTDLSGADVNGDGSVNMKDWIRLKNHLNESDPLF